MNMNSINSLDEKCKVFKRKRKHMFYDYTLITNLMHWLLFIHKILFPLYKFRASSAHLQEDIVVYMVPSLSIRVSGGLSIGS